MNKSLKIILVILSLIVLISVVVVKLRKQEKFQGTCGFVPSGITLQECLDSCNVKRNMGDEACTKFECERKCDLCGSLECQWKQDVEGATKNIRTPLAPRIRGYTGDRQLKIVWVTPKSRLPITRYILVCESEDLPTKFYYPNVSSKLQEYSLFNLENKREYKIRLFAENDAGLSIESNIITMKPEQNKQTPIFSRDIEDLSEIDDSSEANSRKLLSSVKQKYKEKIGYEDEKQDYYKLLKLLNETKPKVDLQDENIKIKFV